MKDPWLFTTLKGHTGIINSMDYSTNGKYLATCADGKFILIFSIAQAQNNCHSSKITIQHKIRFKLANFLSKLVLESC